MCIYFVLWNIKSFYIFLKGWIELQQRICSEVLEVLLRLIKFKIHTLFSLKISATLVEFSLAFLSLESHVSSIS